MWTVSTGSSIKICFWICRVSKERWREGRPQVWGLWAFLRQRRLVEEALRAVSSPWSWSVLFRLMQNLHIHKLWQFKKKKNWADSDFFSLQKCWGTRSMLYATVFYIFSWHIIVVCSYMPPVWLFCICSGKVSKSCEHFQNWQPQKRNFFIENSNWMAYIACWCEHFVWCKNTKQMMGFGEGKKVITACLK